MQKLYLNEDNKLKPVDSEHEATHVHMTIEEYNNLVNANENLRRIVREKSNADRELIPKKERSGYLISGYDTYKLRLDVDEGKPFLNVRRLLLESPYSVSSDFFETENLIYQDIDVKLYKLLQAEAIVKLDSIDSIEAVNEIAESENKIIIIGHVEMQRNGQWAVRLYTNYTPQVPEDFIKQQGGDKND
ncbi:hypothetical protein [[Clostridium] symbiosum]|uniref:Uncharacterized protein n=1 Tax=[Clostridium] symbiosum ATCC 14940 TaxID=411472 RepID=A0ABC9U1N8_CLOSY|nr:hypothetical protein [[Clostridium] symbiosum]ERI79426.1 hypothetical protein CLOSYM_00855 [[Clostridium] symbiosum ATCC 14940]MBS6220118.1 hypothetical protein [[Clostridium] symbiosum]MDM8135530.1 hypothetical protein [[Clostridium] symbiosum]MDM8138929.1 hypothetical protein [[Clostridium] symbiosum]MDM8319843.1 hypothetical protein [[Clostridium] symbiosum]